LHKKASKDHKSKEAFNCDDETRLGLTPKQLIITLTMRIKMELEFDFSRLYAMYPRKEGKVNGMRKCHQKIKNDCRLPPV
jgi:hypothetical protein